MLYLNIMNYEQDIKTLLTIGENIVIEFKRAGNGPEHDTYESICAFLNRQGGDVLLGVDDSGKVVGVPPKAAPAMVRQIVNVMNEVYIRFQVFFVQINYSTPVGSGMVRCNHFCNFLKSF